MFFRQLRAQSNGFTSFIFPAALIGCALAISSCRTASAPKDARLIFVPFDYQGSSATLEWIGRALPSILSSQASGIKFSTIRDAQLNRAGQIVEGYVTGVPGAFKATAIVRDGASQQTIRAARAEGATVLDIASSLARQLTNSQKAYGTSRPEAVQALFSGRVDAAIAADPSYGAARITRLEQLMKEGRNDEIPKALEAARSAQLSDLERAQLDALVATTPKARADALMSMAKVAQYDLQLWRTAADAKLISKDHGAAAEALQRAIEFDPQNFSLWNTLAYTQLFAGDFGAAQKSIAVYRRLQPADSNAVDSLGELYFYDGKFAEAEKEFLAAYEMNNGFIGGGDLYRAALSRFLAGDTAKADEHFRRYLEFRKQHNDALVPVREAIWLYTTGRREAARAKAAAANLPQAKVQIALWDLAEGKTSAAALGDRPELQGWRLLLGRQYPEAAEFWRRVYESGSLVTGNEARQLLAWSLAGANRRPEAAALLQKWPFPAQGPEPGLSSVAWAKTVELKAGLR